MEQHPIPQQISSYEFQLVGNMTLGQFFKLAGGLVLAFILYSSGLPFFFKWPLVLSSAGMGIALAFLPVNDQPLEKWIMAFFKSIYSPTVYLWKKQAVTIDVLDDRNWEQPLEPVQTQQTITPSPEKKSQMDEFLKSLPEEDKKRAKKETDQKISSQTDGPRAEDKSYKQESPVDIKPKIEINLPDQKPLEATAEAEFGDIPMPSKPKTPNIIVGMVTDNQGKILENAIIEIQDNEGNPVRALRSNQLGQFKTATPLTDGTYIILAEKEEHNFDILEIEAKGEVIPPLKIKAK